MKIAAIIQARMGSTRLPGKVLMPLNGKPALQQMIERVQRAEGIDRIIIATPDGLENKLIWRICSDCMSVLRFMGSEEDVLGRVLAAALLYNIDIIVDLTGDCPLVDHRHITQLIKTVKRGLKPWRRTIDYASNICPRSWPDGFDVQVYKASALKKVRKVFNPPHHVGWNILQHPAGAFKIAEGLHAPLWLHWPDLRLTLDTKQDYVVLDKIFTYFRDRDFTAEDVIMLMRQKPEWQEINRGIRTKDPSEG